MPSDEQIQGLLLEFAGQIASDGAATVGPFERETTAVYLPQFQALLAASRAEGEREGRKDELENLMSQRSKEHNLLDASIVYNRLATLSEAGEGNGE